MTDTPDLTLDPVSQPTNGPAAAEPEFAPQWASTAPRGGRTVLNRVLKDGKTVPMFMGQTLINSTLDVDAISKDRNNMIEMRDPVLCSELPSEVVEILTQPLSYPKNPRETQTLFAESEEELRERLGRSGTIIYLPDCDRMSPRK